MHSAWRASALRVLFLFFSYGLAMRRITRQRSFHYSLSTGSDETGSQRNEPEAIMASKNRIHA